MTYHSPVLLEKSIEGLNINPEGIYVDATFGGGGHSKEILKFLNNGKLYAFDQDFTTIQNKINHKSFKLINSNFRDIKKFLRIEGVFKIDGLLADLGVSSYQLDNPHRGFSTRFDGELDMRMNTNSKLSAKYIINNYSEEKLANIFYQYGDLTNARKISNKIVINRSKLKINTTTELKNIISEIIPKNKSIQYFARIFQAIRIEVNDELNALKEMLDSCIDILNLNGRLVVLSYHSLEDRIVKNFIKKGNTEGVIKKDFYGNTKYFFEAVNRKVITASEGEIKINNRSRSVKLRIAEKINEKK